MGGGVCEKKSFSTRKGKGEGGHYCTLLCNTPPSQPPFTLYCLLPTILRNEYIFPTTHDPPYCNETLAISCKGQGPARGGRAWAKAHCQGQGASGREIGWWVGGGGWGRGREGERRGWGCCVLQALHGKNGTVTAGAGGRTGVRGWRHAGDCDCSGALIE